MQTSTFHWHPVARAYVGPQQVARRTRPSNISGLQIISPDPAELALSHLSEILGTGNAFCIGTAPATMPPKNSFVTSTGGSTGSPKLIQRSHASWIASFETNAALFGYTASDQIAVLGPISHSLSLYGILEALHLGMDAHVLAELRPSKQSKALNSAKISILYATPTQLRLLCKGNNIPQLRLILCGGGALDAATRRQIEAACPNADLRVFYGSAETSFVSIADASTPNGSVGRAYPQVEVQVRDANSDGTGTIWVKGPYLFDGYASDQSPHTQSDAEWLTVGEHGWIDEKGNLYIVGRAGRMVTIADQNVFLDDLEAMLAAQPDMPQVAVVALPNRTRGSSLIAVLEGQDNQPVAEHVRQICRDNYGALATPRTVIFADPFPRLPSGKPDLVALTALAGGTT
ncbi:AMP-dependent synthetase [Sulfitobacter sp. SK012]|uniref:AMP-binding protein n=1 Tax=Sulfitobacter sp. SK012 TaxID=1389005 RepID=UPI000E0C581C|nr:AMP-binding protein [Sulfitobacter sp. SK012]AXI44978.1 AMP-dependent synthetase [Sulfitobacter sp. SK012]